MAKTTIKGKGKPITFQKGGLHRFLNVPQGTKIPATMMSRLGNAKVGDTISVGKGMKKKVTTRAKREYAFAKGVLKTGRKTAIAHKKAKPNKKRA